MLWGLSMSVYSAMRDVVRSCAGDRGTGLMRMITTSTKMCLDALESVLTTTNRERNFGTRLMWTTTTSMMMSRNAPDSVLVTTTRAHRVSTSKGAAADARPEP